MCDVLNSPVWLGSSILVITILNSTEYCLKHSEKVFEANVMALMKEGWIKQHFDLALWLVCYEHPMCTSRAPKTVSSLIWPAEVS